LTHSSRTVEPWSAEDIARLQAERRETAELMWELDIATERREGKVALLRRILTLKFGTLSPESVQRLTDAPEQFVDTWAERLVSATTLDDVFAGQVTVEPWSAEDIARLQAERSETAELMWHATMAKAREEGRAQGLAEARTEVLLLRLMTAKFGDLPTSIVDRVREASEAVLDSWAKRVVFAATLDDVFAQP
jgi:hypothetical protein